MCFLLGVGGRKSRVFQLTLFCFPCQVGSYVLKTQTPMILKKLPQKLGSFQTVSFACKVELFPESEKKKNKKKKRTVPKEPTNPLVFESLRICIYIYIYICMHDHTYASMPIWLCLVFGGWHLCPSFSPGSGGYRVAMERTILVWLRESGRTNGAVEPHPSISLESGIPRVPFSGVASGSQRDEEARFEGSPFASGQGSCGVVSKMEGSCNKWVVLPLVSL